MIDYEKDYENTNGLIMKEPFEGLFGNNCESRLLEFLLPLDGIYFNVDELAKEVEVSKETVDRVIKKFLTLKVLFVREIESIAYYGIDLESPIIKSIEQLNNALIENIIGEETLYEIHDYWKLHNKREI